LHDSHIRFALRHHANAICEKPLVLNPWNVDALAEIEKETNQRVYTILQLRHHATIIALREKVKSGPKDKVYDVDLSYITSRGHWYQISWKGDESKSGGVATNIGIHFFDMLIWVFGNVKKNEVQAMNPNYAAGYLELEHARVRWFLSIDYNHIPDSVKAAGKRTYRSITMEGQEIEFSEGFTDLHTVSYREIIEGRGYGLRDAAAAIQVAHDIRHAKLNADSAGKHPLLETAEKKK
jgi:UDP-N-acetyl-2-amino-2-deoxyglucuronate dehydrogenase